MGTPRLTAALVALLLAAPLAAQEAVLPNATVASTANSCSTANAHTTLDDDPASPGVDWCTATTCGGSGTADSSWHLNFATPTGNPASTANAQTFAAYVRRCATGGADPVCRIDVYCNGTLDSTGGDSTITSSTGQLLSRTWTFNGAACASDGSDVEALLYCTRSGGSPSGRRTGDANAVRWTATIAAAGSRRVIIKGD